MKKRFLAAFLALALCIGLAVPASATDIASKATMHFDRPADSGIIIAESKADIFQLRKINTENNPQDYGETYTTDSVTYSDVVWELGVNSGTSMHIRHLDSNEGVEFHAYSDPDGDGIYDQRLFFSEKGDWTDMSFLPVPENGVYNITSGETSVRIALYESENGSVSFSIDWLYELFGANTIVTVGTFDKRTFESTAGSWPLLLTGEEPVLISSVFTDVPVGQWLTSPVIWALEANITNGTSQNAFSPDWDCTHVQILTFLYRAKQGNGAANAADMDAAVAWAKEKGMIDDSFQPSAPCTRAQAVSYIWQALDKPQATKTASFSDVAKNASYADAVSWAVEKGVTNGASDGNTFVPDRVCSRSEIITFLYRAYSG